MPEMLEAALDYAKRGWLVLPLQPRKKSPFGLLVPRGFKEASADPEMIEHWWTQEPDANVGLVTGVAFDVIDIDGPEALANLVEAQAGREMTPGPEVSTGRGYHLYHLPTGLGNRPGFLPSVDFKGKAGYVVAPPSVHPSGHVYTWVKYQGPEGVVDGPDEPLTELPRWLRDLLAQRTVSGSAHRVAPNRPNGRPDRILDAELHKVSSAPERTRNDQLNKSAYCLGQLVAKGRLDRCKVVGLLFDAARTAGLEDDEIRSTVVSGMTAGMGIVLRGAAA